MKNWFFRFKERIVRKDGIGNGFWVVVKRFVILFIGKKDNKIKKYLFEEFLI